MNARLKGGASRVSGGLRFAPTIGFVVLWIAGRVSSSAAADAVPTPYVPYHSATLVVGSPTAAAPQPGDGAPIRVVPPSEPALPDSTSPQKSISPNSRSENHAEAAETTIATPMNPTIDAGRLVPVTLPTAAGAPKPATTDPRPKQSPSPRAELKPAAVQPPTTSSMPSMSSGLPPMTAVTRPDGVEVPKPKSAKAKPSSVKPKNATDTTNQGATTLEAGPLQEIRPPQPPKSVGGAGATRTSTAGVDPTPPKAAKPAAMKKPAAAPPLNLPQPPIPFIEAARKSGRFPGGFRSSRLDRLRSAR